MKILFLIPYPHGEAPSQRFRFEQYQNFLIEAGYQVFTQSFWDNKTWSILYAKGSELNKIFGLIKGLGRRVNLIFRLKKIDYVFIHRECLPIGPPIIEWIIAKVFKKKIIYDFDDAIWIPNTSTENRFSAFLKLHTKVYSICKWSYKVSCGNNFLADYSRRFNSSSIINPTTIDTIELHNPNRFNKRKTSMVTIGWTGTHSTLAYLNPILPVIEQLEKLHRIRFVIIADKEPSFQTAALEFIRWNKATEIEDLMQFDIGIMPLTDDIWSQGKCGFKALQYMSLEIPTVASPVGVNNNIIDQGTNGFLCATQEDWMNTISRLILDEQLRALVGKKGREKVIKYYSVESNKRNFLSLFS